MFLEFKTKKRIVIYLLLLLTIWPPLHYILAKQIHFNHWKFFGLSMYITPTPFVEVEFADLDGSTFLDGNKIFSITNPDAYYKFLEHRTNWGRIYKPNKLANEILGSWRGLKGIKLFVHVAKFDSLKAKPFIVTDIYNCLRGGSCNLVETRTDS